MICNNMTTVEDTIKTLNELDVKSIKKFSLKGTQCKARVVSIYDGDTITLTFETFGTYYKWNCRLDGIDTPEMKSKNPEEKAKAVIARDFLRSKINDKIVDIKCGDFDKYGRLLIKVFYEDVCMNDIMISEGHAKAYFGGTKDEW